jgi:aspartate-semialdehyde dehydrogenase
VFVTLGRDPGLEAIREALRTYRSVPQERNLPSAPAHPTLLVEEDDRPQPRLDVNRERGMASIVGRVRRCDLMGYKFVVLGHNTIRGAAGASILNAELLQSEGLLTNA